MTRENEIHVAATDLVNEPSRTQNAEVKLGPAPAACNICGAVEFLASVNGSLASSGMPSRCAACGSLEHHRIARAVMEALPRSFIEGSRCLRLTVDLALDPAWFAEVAAVDDSNVKSALAQVPSARYDWLYASRSITLSPDHAELEEMLRVVGSGCVLLADDSLAAHYALSRAPTLGNQLRGSEYGNALRRMLPQAALLELVYLDQCSLVLDSLFIVSRESRRLVDMAVALTRRNVHARVFPALAALPETQPPLPAVTPPRSPSVPQSPLARLRASLPREFDEDTYRSLYPDLARLPKAAGHDHYLKHGKNEGRRAHTLADRHAFAGLISQDLDVLEIGPFHDPLASGPRVKYFELLDKQAIIRKASGIGYPIDRTPEVDYVSPEGDLTIVRDTFDVVISSHVVEHQPDLIGHLEAVRCLLRPGGLYFLLVPDRNYCFDYFNAPSTIAELLEAHVSSRKRHTLRSLVAYSAHKTHNDPRRHWRGDHGTLSTPAADIARATEAFLKSTGRYEDVHAWYFEPESFEQAISLLKEVGETGFTLARLYPTLRDCNEFWAILEVESDKP